MKQAIITICLILALTAITDAKPRHHRKPTPKPKPMIGRADKAQLLRSFSDEQIARELAHRLLTIYTVDELMAEQAKREARK